VILTVGRLCWLSGQFDRNGIGVFASDGLSYEKWAIQLCEVLTRQGPQAWAVWPTQLHVRLYSLPLAVFYHWLGFNILAIERLT
jgi:hypothetical protein